MKGRSGVYVIEASGIGRVKVGVSKNVDSRASELQSGSPVPLRVSHVFETDDPYGVERAAHRALARYRVYREWFECSASMAAGAVHAAIRGGASSRLVNHFSDTPTNRERPLESISDQEVFVNYTVPQAAAVAQVSTKTIRRALTDYRRPLSHYRIGRRVVISRRALHGWMAANLGGATTRG